MSLARAAGPCFSSLFTPPPPDSFPSLRRLPSAPPACPQPRAVVCLRSRHHSRARLHAHRAARATTCAAYARSCCSSPAPAPPTRRPRAPPCSLRRPHVPPSPSAAVLHAFTPSTPQPQPPRLQASTPFTPQPQPISARQVLDKLPVRDGSREEEGKGSCGREARSQADSCREGGREGRDGGQGRRGAGIRPCSSVPDQGGPQRQRQRQGYGQSQRCQGHQSRDSSSSSDRFRWF